MKKLTSVLLIAMLIISLAGCAVNEPAAPEPSFPAGADAAKLTDGGAESPAPEASNEPEAPAEPMILSEEGKPIVLFTKDISPEGLMKIYKKLGFTPEGNVAVKLSTGEPPASYYLDPDLIKDLVAYVNGTIVECNTAYGGSRGETAMHYQVAEDHGFTAIANVDILDEEGSLSLPIANGKHLTENLVGSHFENYDSYLVLSHFKGHSMAGFGGAIKNISIGLGSSEGKAVIHSGGKSHTDPWCGEQNDFLESMGEAAKSVMDRLEGKMAFINVMNNLSVDCDCSGHPKKPKMADVGILASFDPVALDKACVDIVYDAKDDGGDTLIRRIEVLNGLLTLEYSEQIGLGSRDYTLINIDD